jgi:hypothetical protein
MTRGIRRRSRAATVLLTGLTAAVLTACAKAEDSTPADVAMQFYVTLEISGVRDLPEPRALAAIEPYLVPTLAAQLGAAYTRRDSIAKAAPTEKPPLADGNPFSSLFEGHSTYGAKSTIMRGDTALVLVTFTNTDQKPAVTWSDTLVLVKPQTTWRIADIRYGTTWEFGYKGALTQLLRVP